MVLETVGVTFRYPHADASRPPALDGVDLPVVTGRRLVVLGANGSGKSTLFGVLLGVLRPDTGEVRLDGETVRHTRRGLDRLRRSVGLVLQDPDDQLFSASVTQDISFGPRNAGLDMAATRARVDAAVAALGLSDLVDVPTHALSYGQRKRVAIAGVLAMAPRVVVLDEPTAGLDRAGAAEVHAALDVLAAQGATLVLSTHDLDLALAWGDDVAVLAAGRVLATGPAPDVLADEAVLAAAGLDRPLAVRLHERLVDRGVLDPSAPAPRSAEALLDLLASLPDPGSSGPAA